MTDADALSAGAVARRLGVAVTTLRSWHQRYGLGPSHHETGQHRRYTTGDLARLEVMRWLTARGLPAAQAARVARSVPSAEERALPALAARGGGGHTIPVGRAGPAARGLARAAIRLDELAMRDLIFQQLSEHGVIHAWDHLLRPVLSGIGLRHAATGRLIEVEHLLSGCISAALATVPRPVAAARVMLACAAEEQHSLPLEALAAALAELGVATRLLGARVPLRALQDAVRRAGPSAVVVWSQDAATADPALLRALLAGPAPPAVVVAAGPGWTAAGAPDGAATPGSLAEVVALLQAISTPTPPRS